MKIDRNCNLVIKIPRDEGGHMYVHAAPLSRMVFDEYAGLFANTFTLVHVQARGPDFGPRFAAAIMRNAAEGLMPPADTSDQLQRNKAAAKGLCDRVLAEIHRLTNVVVPSDRGWDTMPFDDAVRRDLFDEDDVAEVDNSIVFFTLAWRGYPKAERQMMVTQSARMWGGSTTSSNVTEFAASLPTSTEPASSGASPQPA